MTEDEYRKALKSAFSTAGDRPAIPEDVREGVAKVILDKVDIASFEDYGGGALCNAPAVASAVLSYLTSIGWGPTVGREPWGWACWFGDGNTLRDPNILPNYSEDNAREALRRIEHPEWHVVTLYERPS